MSVGDDIVFTISATNGYGDSDESDKPTSPTDVVVQDVPDAPASGPSLTMNAADTSFTVDWSGVSIITNGSPITSYDVKFLNSKAAPTEISSCAGGDTSTTCTVEMSEMTDTLGLSLGGDIQVVIKASNKHGQGDANKPDTSTDVTVETKPEKMDAPTMDFADGVNVGVTWKEPDGYSPSEYTIEI